MSFQGWPEAALDFFEDLERENTKAYWTAHRQVYDEAVLAPMTELTAGTEPRSSARLKIFRPYRDIRFSADKSPYKTEIGAAIGPAYIRLSAAGLGAGKRHVPPGRRPARQVPGRGGRTRPAAPSSRGIVASLSQRRLQR